MRVLVAGGAGFIGSHLVEKLMENEKNEVIVVDNYFTGSNYNLKKLFRLMALIVSWRGKTLVRSILETQLELAETAKELINPKVGIKMVNTPDDPRQKKPDITKAKELRGWEPKVMLRNGLPLTEEDFRSTLGVSEGKK